MNKKDNWDSLYRKKRFYEKQRRKKEKQEDEYFNSNSLFKKEKRIAVMLDIEGTSEWITDETAEIFISQLEKIREQFFAEEGIICISTLDRNCKRIKEVLNVLNRHTTNTIQIGVSFFYGGMYDFAIDYEWITFPNSCNKIKTFMDYMEDKNILWVAFIDDNLSLDTYKKYRNKLPTLVAIPSANKEKMEQNNFMQIATTTKNFDGVIEILASYLTTIQNLTPKEILQKQVSMPIHLSSWEVLEKVHEKNYPFLEQYFLSGCADEGDYSVALT